MEKRLIVGLFFVLLFSSAFAVKGNFSYDAEMQATIAKKSFSPGETITGKLFFTSMEFFPIPEAYAVIYLVQGNGYYYTSQQSDVDNIFVEQKVSGINLSPTMRREYDYNIVLPQDLAPGNYRLDFYAKTEKGFITGAPHIFSSPFSIQISVSGSNGEFPFAKIIRTKTEFHNFLGPQGPGIEPGKEISNNIFVRNTSSRELKNVKVFVGLCEWDDTACSKFDSQDTAKIDSIKAGEEKSARVKLVAPQLPDAYSIRIEVRDENDRLLSLYRNRSIVYGGTAKIHKMYVSDFKYNTGDKGNVKIMLGPSPDHYTFPSFKDFDVKVSIQDLWSNNVIFEKSERVTEINPKAPNPYLEKSFDFTVPNALTNFRVCGSVEKQGVVHENYCFVVDASKFRVIEKFSDIDITWNFVEKERRLDIEFSLRNPELSRSVDAAYALSAFSTSELLGESVLDSLPNNISFSGLKDNSYTLILNNFLTRQQSQVEINIGSIPAGERVKSCTEQNGFICTGAEVCNWGILVASDSGLCCSVKCSQPGPKPPPKCSSFWDFCWVDPFIIFVIAVIIVAIIAVLVLRKGKKIENEWGNYGK